MFSSHSNVTLFDLAVPDTFCSPDPDAGYQCQNDMVCMELAMSPAVMGFNGFDHLRQYLLLLSYFPSYIKDKLLYLCFILQYKASFKKFFNFHLKKKILMC